MAPGLRDGDVVLALGRTRPRTGDVVIVEHPRRPGFELVKRVAGSPGAVVRMSGDGSTGSIALGAGEWFLVGDAPGASTDSRSFGPVRAEHLRGVVRLVLWPPRRVRVVRRLRGTGLG